MPEVIVFPDAAELVIEYLDDNIGTPVFSKVPNPRLDEFVTVRRSGGVRQTLVSDAATILVECWAPTEGGAQDLAQIVRGYIFAMRGTTQDAVAVYHVDEFAGPATLPDPVSNQERVVLTMSVHFRGNPLPTS